MSFFRQFLITSLLLFCAFVSVWNDAWAGKLDKLSFDVAGAFTLSMPKSSPSTSGSMGFPGGGLIINYRWSRRVSLEAGGLYLTQVMNNGQNRKISMLQGLMGLKYHLGGDVFFVDLGGYGNYHLQDEFTVTGRDGGVYGGMGIRIRPTKTVGFVARVQYDYALTQLEDTRGVWVVPSQIMGIIGFSFGLGTSK